jgi:hypothetical protein
MSIDISTFDPINDRPKTLYNIQMTSTPAFILFVFDLFVENKFTNILKYKKEELYERYRTWMALKMPRSPAEQYNPFCKKLEEYSNEFTNVYGRHKLKVSFSYELLFKFYPHLFSKNEKNDGKEEESDSEDEEEKTDEEETDKSSK